MERRHKNQAAFCEEQRFRQPLFWVIVLAVAGLVWVALALRLLTGRPAGPNPMPDPVLAISWLFFGVGLPTASWTSRLITEVRDDGIHIRFIPFHAACRVVSYDEVEYCQVTRFDPPAEYGGWGPRFGLNGRAYTVVGNRGVRLDMADGRHLLIGSQAPDSLAWAIDAMMKGR